MYISEVKIWRLSQNNKLKLSDDKTEATHSLPFSVRHSLSSSAIKSNHKTFLFKQYHQTANKCWFWPSQFAVCMCAYLHTSLCVCRGEGWKGQRDCRGVCMCVCKSEREMVVVVGGGGWERNSQGKCSYCFCIIIILHYKFLCAFPRCSINLPLSLSCHRHWVCSYCQMFLHRETCLRLGRGWGAVSS